MTMGSQDPKGRKDGNPKKIQNNERSPTGTKTLNYSRVGCEQPRSSRG